MLSRSAEEIIRILIHQDNTFITNKRIAQMAGISERSVNNYMREVSDYCEENECRLIRKRGKGICLDMGRKAKELKQIFSQKKISFENRDTRVNYIVRTLIESKEPYTAGLFADEFFVSKATVRTDLEHADEYCKRDYLMIRQVVGKGIEIVGSEFWKRKVLVCRNQKVSQSQYESIGQAPDLRIDKLFYSRLTRQYRKNIVDGVIFCIQELEKQMGCQFNDYTFCMIAEYTSCQIKRIKSGAYLEETMINQLTLVEEIADWAVAYNSFLNQRFQLALDPREGLYLYIMLLGAEVQNSSRLVNKKFLIEKEISIEDVTDQVITYLSAIVGLDFSGDPLLQTSLALFLNSSLVRVKYGFEIKNPFLEEVKKTYSAIFSACLTAGKEYEELVGLLPTEDEISYMAILFSCSFVQHQKKLNTAVIGSGGVGITQIIAQKIEAKLPEINIITVLPSNSALFIKENQYDLVITTIPYLKINHPNVVYTTLLVGEQDIYRMKKTCHEILESNVNQTKSYTIQNLLKRDLILLEHEDISKEMVLKKACSLLLEKGYVKEGFYESVMQREEISASVLGGGMAVPHGISDFVNHPAVVVIRTDKKVEWGEGAVDVIFLLALNFDEIESTRAFFSAFYEMTMQKESARLIRKAPTQEEIKQIIINNS
ncbi:MAG: PTS sugar transporter subunit IIA [Anaerostipes sp.]|nr:PTS sugar transporter subunit IIA [Anaerostipes sp.]MDD3747681.1 PTS sugar transporter subunit IIA [Anaerostipes sp.]